MTCLAIIGTGLIGSSFALASRDRGVFDRVIGSDQSVSVLRSAIERGICDREITETDRPDAVCVATPTRYIAGIVESTARKYGPDVPIFDVGSVKAAILNRFVGDCPSNYVPCHPIAGSDKNGPQAADANLFQGKKVILTPSSSTRNDHLETVASFWTQVGSEVVQYSSEEHDAKVALCSHLPHLVSFAFMRLIVDREEELKHSVGSGFRDFTRIAGAEPDVWQQILEDNNENVLREMRNFLVSLDELSDLASSDAKSLHDELSRISDARRKWDGF